MGRFSPTDDLRDLRLVFSGDVDLTAPERSVMGVLILHRNGETGRCDPSLNRIADSAGMDRRTVMRALSTLEDAGHVERHPHRDGRTRTGYTVHPPTRGTETLGAESHQGQSDPRVGAESHRGRGTVPPERTKERANERTNGDFDVRGLWTVYVEEMNASAMKLTDKRRKKLQALYTEQLNSEDDPLGMFRQILQTVQRSDHHMAKRSYQTVESLFVDEERRERWTLDAKDATADNGTDNGYMSRDELWAETEGGA